MPLPSPPRAAQGLILTRRLAGSKGCWSRSNPPRSCEEVSAGCRRSSRQWEGLSPLERKAQVRSKLYKQLLFWLLVTDIQGASLWNYGIPKYGPLCPIPPTLSRSLFLNTGSYGSIMELDWVSEHTSNFLHLMDGETKAQRERQEIA